MRKYIYITLTLLMMSLSAYAQDPLMASAIGFNSAAVLPTMSHGNSTVEDIVSTDTAAVTRSKTLHEYSTTQENFLKGKNGGISLVAQFKLLTRILGNLQRVVELQGDAYTAMKNNITRARTADIAQAGKYAKHIYDNAISYSTSKATVIASGMNDIVTSFKTEDMARTDDRYATMQKLEKETNELVAYLNKTITLLGGTY